MYVLLLFFMLFFLVLSLVRIGEYKKHNALMMILLVGISLIFGFRYGVGKDYFTYENSFYYDYNSSFEPIYNLFSVIIKNTMGEFFYLTLIISFLTNLFIYLGIVKRDIKNIYAILAIFIYMSSMALIFANLMRQGLSVAIFFYCSSFIKERNFKKYLTYIILGAGFHISMLLMLPLYFVRKLKITLKIYSLLIIAAYTMVITGFSQIAINKIAFYLPNYSFYYNSSFFFLKDYDVLSYGVLVKVILLFLLLLFTRKVNYQLEVNYYMLGLVINVLSISSFMFDRIGIYFQIFGLVAIPQLLLFIKNSRLKKLLFLLTLIISILLLAQSLFINPESSMLKYRSIFSI